MKISVIIDEQGEATIEGQLQNKVLCYGLLQVGMDLVRNHKPGPQIQVVPGAVLSMVRPPNGGDVA